VLNPASFLGQEHASWSTACVLPPVRIANQVGPTINIGYADAEESEERAANRCNAMAPSFTGSMRRARDQEGQWELRMDDGTGRSLGKVHVIDDDDGFRVSMTRLLCAAGYEAAGYRCAADFLLVHGRENVTGCILLDISMPGPSGIDLLNSLAAYEYPPPVIFVTGRDDIGTTVCVMKSGALDYVVKPVRARDILPRVRMALELDAEQRQARREIESIRARFESLTPAERSIFDGIMHDRLNKQLAADLGICERTIKNHRSRMLRKLQVRNIPELVKIARRLDESDQHAAPRSESAACYAAAETYDSFLGSGGRGIHDL
jgi:FixJ family two-component response regulator